MFGSQSSVRSSVRVTRRPGGESSHIDGIFGFDRRPSAAAPAPAEPSAKPAADAATSTDGLEGLASSFFSMGLNTLKIPMSLHAENRFRLLNAFSGSDVPRNSFILLEGARDVPHHSEDTDYPFKQESYFLWAFGVAEPDFNGLIDVDERRAILFCPRFPQEYAVWMGKIQPPSHFRDKYGVDEALYADELDSYLAARDPSALYVLKGLNTDSGRYVKPASFPGIEKYRVDDGRLFPVATECRVVKSAKEIEVMRYVCKVSSEAHTEVMKWVRPGAMEYQAESIFLHECYSRGGCRFTGYTCICCAGETGAVLHYGHAGAPNNRPIADGDMCLFDMGAEYHGYTADITVSFPASGKFSADQRLVYGAVLAAVKAVEAAVKPGVSWPEMHRLAERTMLEALAKGGLLKARPPPPRPAPLRPAPPRFAPPTPGPPRPGLARPSSSPRLAL
eukprot:tig00021070_g17890.t1